MYINPGKMKYKITIQNYTAFYDEIGNEKLMWSDLLSCYARVNGLYGQRYWRRAAQGAENTLEFTIRFSKKLNELITENQLTKFRVIFNGKRYKITGYDNIDFRNKLVKIKGVENEQMQY